MATAVDAEATAEVAEATADEAEATADEAEATAVDAEATVREAADAADWATDCVIASVISAAAAATPAPVVAEDKDAVRALAADDAFISACKLSAMWASNSVPA